MQSNLLLRMGRTILLSIAIAGLMLSGLGGAQSVKGLGALPKPNLPAFPGAVGFGTETVGGRGGRVIFVTNTNDSGPGSFRDAVGQSGARVVIFKTGGLIQANSIIKITNPFITIAGQTAPGNGIAIKGSPIFIQTHDVIIRGLKMRIGDGPGAKGSDRDGITADGGNATNIVVDHNSIAWAVDEGTSLFDESSGQPHRMTFSYNIIAESLHYPNISNEGDTQYKSMGFLIASPGSYVTVHHNLISSNYDRNPWIKSSNSEVINNVIYNWGIHPISIASGNMNAIGNRMIETAGSSKWGGSYVSGIHCWVDNPVKVYLSGNIGPGKRTDWDTTSCLGSVEAQVKSTFLTFSGSGITSSTANKAYTDVLNGAGSFPRDSVDQRIVNNVINQTSPAPGKWLIASQSEVGGWPSYPAGSPPPDSDNDGLPDTWDAPGRNPSDLAPSGYTWIEEYINSFFSFPTDSSVPTDIETPTISPIPPTQSATPSPLPGLAWEAEDGEITAPFSVVNGVVSQNVLTTIPADGGRALYQFTIQDAGDYMVRATVNAADASSNSFYVGMDTEPDTSMIWDVPLTNGFEEREVFWRGGVSPDSSTSAAKLFILAPGEHTLIFRGREIGTHLDKVEVAKAPIVQPTNTAIPTATQAPIQTPSSTPSTTPTSIQTPVIAAPPPAGKLFGPFDYIPDGSNTYTLTRTNYQVSNLEAVRAHGVKAFVAVTGSKSNYYTNGCFDLQKWKDLFARRSNGLQPFVDDGTIVGLYAIDEPDDEACGPTYEELNEVCRYAHEKLPGIACGFNTEAAYLAQGRDLIPEIDYIFDQTNFGHVGAWGGWTEWAEAQFADAWWFDGPIYLSINAYSYSPTDKQVNDAAIELCQTDVAGVMMWKWDYVQQRDMSRAIAACAGQEPTPSETPTSSPTVTPTPIFSATSPPLDTIPPVITEIRNQDNIQLLLTFSEDVGATGSEITNFSFSRASSDIITIDSINYDSNSYTTTLNINGGNPLPPDNYTIVVTGTRSITDLAGNKLDGNADGIGGDDFVHSFSIQPPTTAPTEAPVVATSTPTPEYPTATASLVPPSPTATATSVPPTPTTEPTTQPAVETIYDDKDSAFTFSGWFHVGKAQAYGNSFRLASTYGSFATLDFTGQSFSVLYKSGPNYGVLNVYVDGILVGSINQNESPQVYQQRWDYPGQLAPGAHSLTLVFVSPGYKGSIDAVIVRTTEPPAPVLPTPTSTSAPPTSIATETLAPMSPTPTATSVPPTETATASPLPPSPTATDTSVPPTPTTEPTTQPAVETIYDDKDSAFTFSGWFHVGKAQAYGNSFRLASTYGSFATLDFTGQSFSVLYKSGPNYGVLNVYVDGMLVGSIDQNESPQVYQQRWDYPGQLAPGAHTLTLVFVSPGYKGSIDAVIVR